MSGEMWKHSSGPEGRIPWRIKGHERIEPRFVCNSTVAITDSSDANIRGATISRKRVETSVKASRKLGKWHGGVGLSQGNARYRWGKASGDESHEWLRCETKPRGNEGNQSAKRLRKPVGAAQSGQVRPV
jgi:hypothetical protein